MTLGEVERTRAAVPEGRAHAPRAATAPAERPRADSRTRPSVAGAWIPQLDGLRGLAALAVVLAHFDVGPLVPGPSSFYGLIVGLRSWSVANLAVVFFYVLSAFLLTYLLVREQDGRGRVNVRRFYVRRVLRIWPLYLALVAVNLLSASPWGLLAPPLGGDLSTWAWVREHLWLYLGFLGNWSLALNYLGGYVDRSTPGLAVLWSIALEEQFYLVYPLLMVAALGSRGRARAVLGGAVLVGWLFRLGFLTLVPPAPELPNTNRLYFATLTYADVFALGCAAGWLAARRAGTCHWLQRGLRSPLAGPLLGLGLVGLAGTWTSAGAAAGCTGPLCVPALYGMAAVLLALTVLWTVLNPDTLVSRALASAPLRALGLLSFGIYVWHPVALAYVRHDLATVEAAGPADLDALALATFGLYLGTTFLAATVTYRLVERPFLSLKDRLAGRGRSPGVVRPVLPPRSPTTPTGATATGTVPADPHARTPTFRWWLVAATSIGLLVVSAGYVQVWFGPANLDRLGGALPARLGQQSLPSGQSLTAYYVDVPRLRPGAAMLGPDGAPATLAAGQAAYDARRGELFAFDGSGRATLLVGGDGQRVRLANLGAWDAVRGTFAGLDLVTTRAGWRLDRAALHPANPNSTFVEVGGPDAPAGAGWHLESGGAPLAVEHLGDDLGPFLRLRATTDGQAVRLTGRSPLPPLNGAPVTVRAVVRSSHPGLPIAVEMVDAAPGAKPRRHTHPADAGDRWDSHTLIVPAVHDPDVRDAYALAAGPLRAGGWLDVREVSVYVGVVP